MGKHYLACVLLCLSASVAHTWTDGTSTIWPSTSFPTSTDSTTLSAESPEKSDEDGSMEKHTKDGIPPGRDIVINLTSMNHRPLIPPHPFPTNSFNKNCQLAAEGKLHDLHPEEAVNNVKAYLSCRGVDPETIQGLEEALYDFVKMVHSKQHGEGEPAKVTKVLPTDSGPDVVADFRNSKWNIIIGEFPMRRRPRGPSSGPPRIPDFLRKWHGRSAGEDHPFPPEPREDELLVSVPP